MRGNPLGGPDKRLRVDFADPEPYNYNFNSAAGANSGVVPPVRNVGSNDSNSAFQATDSNTPLDSNVGSGNQANDEWQEENDDKQWNSSGEAGLQPTSPRNGQVNKRPRPSDSLSEQGLTKKSRQSSLDDVESDVASFDRGANVIISENVSTVQELIKCCPVAWNGGLILKTMKFPARMLLCDGDISLVDLLMKDPNSDSSILRITQRLRLDPIRLEDVSRRMSSSGHCMLLTTAGSDKFNKTGNGAEDIRPLRNLVSYLKQKEAAGVVSLSSTKEDTESSGVLYVFPPCAYALDLLKKVAPNLNIDLSSKDSKEDYLLVVVVKNQ